MKIDWNRKYTTIAVYAGLTGAALIALVFAFKNFEFFSGWGKRISGILNPVWLGMIMAYLFNPILKFAEKRIFRWNAVTKRQHSSKRALGLIFTYIVVLIILTIFLLLVIPQVYASGSDLASKMSGYIEQTLTWINEFLSKSKFIGGDINNLDDVFNKALEIFNLNMETIGSKIRSLSRTRLTS